MAWETMDLDLDGHEEVSIHSSAFAARVSPQRGGAIEELTLFASRVNLANTLTRRREAYHLLNGQEGGEASRSPASGEEGHGQGGQGAGTPSIHDLEEGLLFDVAPPVDSEDRALFRERVVPAGLELKEYEKGGYTPIWSWGARAMTVRSVQPVLSAIVVALEARRGPVLEKTFVFEPSGGVEVHFRWEPGAFPAGSYFTSEISLGAEAVVTTDPEARLWRHPISTFSKSERGFDETVQGESVTVGWVVTEGEGRVRLGWG